MAREKPRNARRRTSCCFCLRRPSSFTASSSFSSVFRFPLLVVVRCRNSLFCHAYVEAPEGRRQLQAVGQYPLVLLVFVKHRSIDKSIAHCLHTSPEAATRSTRRQQVSLLLLLLLLLLLRFSSSSSFFPSTSSSFFFFSFRAHYLIVVGLMIRTTCHANTTQRRRFSCH